MVCLISGLLLHPSQQSGLESVLCPRLNVWSTQLATVTWKRKVTLLGWTCHQGSMLRVGMEQSKFLLGECQIVIQSIDCPIHCLKCWLKHLIGFPVFPVYYSKRFQCKFSWNRLWFYLSQATQGHFIHYTEANQNVAAKWIFIWKPVWCIYMHANWFVAFTLGFLDVHQEA